MYGVSSRRSLSRAVGWAYSVGDADARRCPLTDPQIQNTIATMAYRRPSDASPEDWYEAAKNVDQNRAANEAFKLAYRTSALPLPAPLKTLFAHRVFSRSLLQYPSTQPRAIQYCKGNCGAELNRFLAGGPKLIYYNR